jgi:hypothetical protein
MSGTMGGDESSLSTGSIDPSHEMRDCGSSRGVTGLSNGTDTA